MDNLEAAVKALESKSEKAKEAKDSSSVWGWVIALVIGAIISIGAALLMRKLNKKNEELAKLRTKIEQDQVFAEQAKLTAKVAQLRGEGTKLVAEAKILQNRVTVAKSQLEKEEEKHLEMVERISAAKGWAEINALAPKL